MLNFKMFNFLSLLKSQCSKFFRSTKINKLPSLTTTTYMFDSNTRDHRKKVEILEFLDCLICDHFRLIAAQHRIPFFILEIGLLLVISE